MLKEGWKSIGKVFILAIVLDVVYQLIEHRWTVYPGEASVGRDHSGHRALPADPRTCQSNRLATKRKAVKERLAGRTGSENRISEFDSGTTGERRRRSGCYHRSFARECPALLSPAGEAERLYLHISIAMATMRRTLRSVALDTPTNRSHDGPVMPMQAETLPQARAGPVAEATM